MTNYGSQHFWKVRGEKRGIFLFSFFGRIGEDELAACWFFIGYSSLLAWPPTRLSASMDLAPLFLAFRFSGGREREGSAPGSSANRSGCPFISRRELFAIVGDGKGSPGSSASFGSSPMPAKYVNSRYLHTRWTSLVFVSASVYMCVFACVLVIDRIIEFPCESDGRGCMIRNEIKQRGIYRSRRGINTILMKIRQLGGSILSRLLNLDLKNIRCRQKRGGTLNIARIGPMILTDRNTIPFEFFLRFSKLCHEERRWVYLSGMKKERLQDSMVVLDNQLNRWNNGERSWRRKIIIFFF